MSKIIVTPFTDEQVEGLQRWQEVPYFHPYTCGFCRNANEYPLTEDYALIPTVNGWVCPTCDNVQEWAYAMSVISEQEIEDINRAYGSFFGENEEKGDLSYLFTDGPLNLSERPPSNVELELAVRELKLACIDFVEATKIPKFLNWILDRVARLGKK